jgi:predicted nucleic acid-binding protein
LLIAPFIWPLEIANVLRSALRQGRMGLDQAANVARHAVNLDLRITPPWHDEPLRYLDLRLTHELTPYDAIYLELALAQHAALATRDWALAAAAQRLGVTVHH